MSAYARPVWGRASGRFSTLTARTGRFGTCPPAAWTPVSGHVVTGLAEDPVPPPSPVPWDGPGLPAPSPANSTTPATTPTTVSTAIVDTRVRPRADMAKAEHASYRGGRMGWNRARC